MQLSSYYQDFARDLAKLVGERISGDPEGPEESARPPAVKNLAALARLRRGLGKTLGEAPDCCSVLRGWLTSGATSREDACFLVATLFALHQGSWHPADAATRATNIGASFLLLRNNAESASESTEQRFVALLNCHADDLGPRLRNAVALLRSGDISIDWGQLLYDVEHWSSERRFVQRNWARAYWGDQATGNSKDPKNQVVDGVADPA